ncbi:uncharacterized protein METZ01_LOCUS217871 [marine metagenome]|uniref:Orotate phosphoribosyltransferase n=1 Tax=marine metagenome TaxID=408172 RepID=A0A382FS94_9ZZZZ
MPEEQPQQIESQPTKDERTWAMLCHFSAFTGLIFPFGNFLAPLIIWLIKKEELPFVEDQGKEVLNFQISMTIYLLISGILCIILIGIPIVIGLVIFCFIITIIAAISANDGKTYRYPMNLRLIK